MKKFYILLFSFVLILVGNVGQANAAGFTDVKPGDSFYKEMMYLDGEDIISGYTDGRFGPSDTVTRGQAAMMIAKTLDLNTAPSDTKFSDVKSDYFASGAIQSAAIAGILSGTTDGKFLPKKPVTRGEMAIFIARAFELTDEELISFTDVGISKTSYSSIRKILAAGVTAGYTATKFRPDELIERQQFSAFLARAMSDQFRLDVDVCGYVPEPGENPDRQTVNCLLTKEALKANIPPEIVKAVATVENGSWKQFELNGDPLVTEDGGIGIMQITTTEGYDVDRLKNEISYNIYAGVDMLSKNFKRTVLPSVGEKNPADLESWYFAVMAYNGTKATNSPFVKSTGLRNDGAYQEKVFRSLNITTHIDSIDMSADDFIYLANNNIDFQQSHFPIVGNVTTLSKEMFEDKDTVRYEGNGLRPQPGTKPDLYVTKTTTQETITIVGGLVYDNNNPYNTFGWYPAKVMRNGDPVFGYIASTLIQ
ncbi:S-layer homology domain-containing protein [Paenisporosarcina macmurdoensis]|uniref:S-layer homology domain-containing protein n=1 Tax=Paenisporosarcina macmurdoensis TaxID=212659 RepID=A0ABW1LAW0_9BACL